MIDFFYMLCIVGCEKTMIMLPPGHHIQWHSPTDVCLENDSGYMGFANIEDRGAGKVRVRLSLNMSACKPDKSGQVPCTGSEEECALQY